MIVEGAEESAASPGACGPVVRASHASAQSESSWGHLDLGRWADLATLVLRDQDVACGELGLHMIDSASMAALNSEHMGESGPTDVLAFPLDALAPSPLAPGTAPLLGDVVVCPERAQAQAAQHLGAHHDGSLEDEMALLVVHGVLHVLGHDHRDDAETQAMQALERRLIAAHHRRQ